ncbi:MAG: LptF/LptG family permease, partial [Leptospiraceae bacterium]|nr:LptF/LptG family permease [Leptospiraceae bacterium]
MSEEKKKDLRTVRLTSKDDLPEDFKVHTDVRRWNPFYRIPILNRYIFFEIIGPFLASLSFFTFIYMVMALQKMIGLFVGKGVEFSRLLDYFGYLLGNTLPSTIPMACLMSGILAAGRLSGDSEITAMRSAGVSYGRIYTNFLFFGFIMTLVVGYLNFYVGPENTRKMNEFNNWIVAYNPMLAVTPGQFSGDQVKDNFETRARTMYTEGMNRDTGELNNVQIREWELNADGMDFITHNGMMIQMGNSRIVQVISAKSGYPIEKVNPDGEFEKGIRLREGFIIEWNEKKDGLTFTNFLNGEMDYNIPTLKEKKVIGFNIKPETFAFPELIKIRNNIQSEGIEEIPGLEMLKEAGLSIKGIGGFQTFLQQMKMEILSGVANKTMESAELNNRYAIYTQLESLFKDTKKVLVSFNVEIHKRIASPLSCQLFFFLSLPLGLVANRSGKGMGFTYAVIALFVYYGLFILGSGISYKSNVPDWVGPWSANIVIGIAGVYFLLERTELKFTDTPPGKLYLKIKHFYFKRFSKFHNIIM